jgi:hypothetical protein
MSDTFEELNYREMSDWATRELSSALIEGPFNAAVFVVTDRIYHAAYMTGYRRGYLVASEHAVEIQRVMEVGMRFVRWVLEQPERADCFDDTANLSPADMERIMETCDEMRRPSDRDDPV